MSTGVYFGFRRNPSARVNVPFPPGGRALHYVGTTLTLANLLAFLVILPPWFLGGAVLSGYGFAWAGHFFVENNRPATFSHPLWSLVSDFRTYFTWLGGRLGRHRDRAGVRPAATTRNA